MELEARIADIAKVIRDHREVLATEEAAKTALVMPFLQLLGYNVFNPSEVVPEFTCDVATKKGEKVDYAICVGGSVNILIECKPASSDLSIKNAAQLFRYFTTTSARVAVLTNGVVYKFFSDIDLPNIMDDKPFFTFDVTNYRKGQLSTLSGFSKESFDIEKIVKEAADLKLQSLVYKEIVKEIEDPSEELVRVIAGRVTGGRFKAQTKDIFRGLIVGSFNTLIRDRVNDRLTSALSASNPADEVPTTTAAADDDDGIVTTEEEVSGFHIVQAICAQVIDPKRVVMRDAKAYCAILLDDNNRKSIVRLHFNSPTARYLGTFVGKDEVRNRVAQPVDIYQHAQAILARIAELEAP